MIANPFIVGIGGTTNPGSSTERALTVALDAAREAGAMVRLFDGPSITSLPHYAPGALDRSEVARELVAAVRAADGLIIASPGYHGSISGLVKNAIDYLEETSRDKRVYLDGMPVGLIVTAYGWQATGSTLGTLRSIVHALRGWPTPLGAAVKATPSLFVDGECTDPAATAQLRLVGNQVVEFARLRQRVPSVTATGPSENEDGDERDPCR
jgi:FMN reductase